MRRATHCTEGRNWPPSKAHYPDPIYIHSEQRIGKRVIGDRYKVARSYLEYCRLLVDIKHQYKGPFECSYLNMYLLYEHKVTHSSAPVYTCILFYEKESYVANN